MPQSRNIRDVEVPPGSEIAIVQAFARANALNAASACPLATLGLTITPTYEDLVARGFLYRAPADGWYLDLPRYLARRFRRRVQMIAVAAFAALLLAWFLARAF